MHDVTALCSSRPERIGPVAHAALVVCAGALAAGAADRMLVEGGKACYVAVLPDREVALHYPAGETLCYAADFLNEYLAKTCGATLPVLQEGAAADEPRRVFLGPTDSARRHVGDLAALHREELVVRTVGRDVVVCGRLTDGKVDEGTLYGVYEFCERVLGIRWYFVDEARGEKSEAGMHVPKRDTITVPELDVRDRPAFLQHEGLIRQWWLPEELARRWHPVLRFGNVRDQKTPNHTQSSWYNRYHETHPEYFAKTYAGKPMLNPKARGIRNYICFSNPAVLEQMIQNTHEWDTKKTPSLFGFSDKHTPGPHTVYFCPNDGLTAARVCKCPACRKRTRLDRSFDGQLSELVWEFIRRYAIAIDARRPGRRLGVLAYSCYQQPPATVEIRENVDVTLVFRDIIYMHDPEVWDANMGRFDAWRRLLANRDGRLSLWYNVGTLNIHSYVPAMYIHAFRRMMQHFQKHGVAGHHICGFNPRLRRAHWPASQRLVTASLYPFLRMQSRIL